MESVLESEWNFFSNVMYSNEESDFMAQLLNDCSVSTDFHGGSSFIWSDHEFQNTTMVDVDYKTDSLGNNGVNPNMARNYDSYYYAADNCNEILGTNNDSISSDYCMKEASDLLDDDFLNRGMVVTDSIMQEAPLPKPEPSKKAELNHPVQKPKKRCYNARDTVQKNKRNVKSRKNQKLTSSCKISDEDTKSAICRQCSSSYGSDDDYEFNAANGRIPVPLAELDTKGGAPVDTNAKTRASRGSANDPQSLYARKRRERINGRLKTLQNLVPNGTKVDISTMLEEAVQYVKFLQLQIKLLSSDDLWMYAPIAYNGMDLGLNLNITMPMPRQ